MVGVAILKRMCYIICLMTILDSLDEQLVHLLAADARQSNERLGQQLNVSATTVRRRLRKLTASGVLHMTARIDPNKAGLPLVTMISFDISHDKLASAIKVLKTYPEVKWLSTTTGRFDIMALAAFHSTQELSAFLQEQVARIEGLRGTETYICLEVSKEPYIPV